MLETERPFRPYAPPANVQAVLQRIRRMNTPPRLTREFLRGAGVTENLISRVLAALRFLELINDVDEPTDTLRALAVAPDEEYRKLLEAALRKVYADDFQNIDPAVDPQHRILDTFQKYQPSSQHMRQVMLFLGLCREAGISVVDAPRERGMQERRGKAAKTKTTAKPAGKPASNGRVRGTPLHKEDPPPSRAGGTAMRFGVTDADLELLEPEEFERVWAALGLVVGGVTRARARANRRQPAQAEAEEEQEE